MDKELARLAREKQNAENEIRRAEGMLDNPGHLAKAPAALIESTRESLRTPRACSGEIQERIEEMKITGKRNWGKTLPFPEKGRVFPQAPFPRVYLKKEEAQLKVHFSSVQGGKSKV